MADVEKDFEEFLELFNKHRVKYCIIGAFAVGFHAIPRYTKDLDVLVEPTEENAERILAALKDFGFGSLALNRTDFVRVGHFVQLGFEPVRIDVVTLVDASRFQKMWSRRVQGELGREKVHFVHLEDLVQLKKQAGRKQDAADIEVILKLKRMGKKIKKKK